jgi:hypothetical protein
LFKEVTHRIKADFRLGVVAKPSRINKYYHWTWQQRRFLCCRLGVEISARRYPAMLTQLCCYVVNPYKKHKEGAGY